MLSHGLQDITLIILVAGLSAAMLYRLRQSVLAGYALAGVLLGPFGFAVIASGSSVFDYAAPLMWLLLFAAALELSLRGFKRIYGPAFAMTVMQMSLSVLAMLAAALIFGWPMETAIVFGFAIAFSSTAVSLSLLREFGALQSDIGRLVIGITVAQNLAIVPILLTVDGMASGANGWYAAVPTLGAVIGLSFTLRQLTHASVSPPSHLGRVLGSTATVLFTRNRDLTLASALGCGCVAACVSSVMGVTPAFGIFLAGLWLGATAGKKQILRAINPLRKAAAPAFFFAAGLALDLPFIQQNWAEIVTILAALIFGKAILNMAVFRVCGEPGPRSWLSGLALAHCGELSMIVVVAAVAGGILTAQVQQLLLAVILLSLVLSPVFVAGLHRIGGEMVLGRSWLHRSDLPEAMQQNRTFFSLTPRAPKARLQPADFLNATNLFNAMLPSDNDNHLHNKVPFRRPLLVIKDVKHGPDSGHDLGA